MSIKPQQMEIFAASQIAESLGRRDRLMEMILERNNKFFVEQGLYLPGN